MPETPCGSYSGFQIHSGSPMCRSIDVVSMFSFDGGGSMIMRPSARAL